jgi:hypothetical protein
MRRDDYILRVIAEGVRTLYHIIGLRKIKEYAAARKAIDEACLQLTTLRVADLEQLSDSDLIARLTFAEPSQLAHNKIALVANLLEQLGGIASAERQIAEADEHFLCALVLVLYLHRQPTQEPLPKETPNVEKLVAAVGLQHLPAQLCADLIDYYERVGDFARAEDALFALIKIADDQRAAVQHGLALAQRLLQRNDNELQAGNLQRHEVLSMQAELQRRLA